MRLGRVAAALCAASAWLGCRDTTASGSPYLVLAPVLDSLLVGDQLLAPSVTYYDGAGNTRIPARTEVSWASSDPATRSEEHTSELQSQSNLVCRLLLEKKKTIGHEKVLSIISEHTRIL